MPQKIRFILNPITNHGRSVADAATLRPLTQALNAEWVQTTGPRHAIKLARTAGAEGFDLVVAAGGDGTVHEVINGLMQVPTATRPALGILPLGSGNDFAHILGVPSDPSQALQACLTGQPVIIDIGLLTGAQGRQEYFNNTVGIGFDAVVTIHTRRMTRIHGFMMYLVATLRTIFRDFKAMDLQVRTDQETWQQAAIMLTLGNGPREGGGFNVTPQAKLDDGIFNYIAIQRISRLMMLRLVPEVMAGTHTRFKQVRSGVFKTMELTSTQPLYVHCDGEIYAGFDSIEHALSIQIIPQALRIIKQA